MGMDVNLYARGKVTDEQFDFANSYVNFYDSGFGDEYQETGSFLRRAKYPEDRVEYWTLERYFDEHYQSGHWPATYTAIRVMQAAFPDHQVFYGSDSDDEGGELCTREFLENLWNIYLKGGKG